jgi:phosphopantetheine--protein transferase-like protein
MTRDPLLLALPHGLAAAVAVGEGELPVPGRAVIPLEDALAALLPEEQARAAELAPVRRRDWVAGRLALRAALAGAGLACDRPVLADDRGAPVLPEGLDGSVSHKRGLAVALAAARGPHRVGVDVELLVAPRLDLAPRVLTADERAAVAALDPAARGRAVTLRFSIKEAIYKAIDPFVRRYVGFREVAVWPEESGAVRVEVVAGADLPLEIEAAWTAVGELVVCSARARGRG